jgi:NitT/TauT family transport system permease protein
VVAYKLILGRLLMPLISFLVVAGLWEAVIVIFDLPAYILPRPFDIVVNAVTRFDVFYQSSLLTFSEVGIGFLLGSAIGILIALLMALAPRIERLSMPVIVLINCVPPVAFIPLALIWFGLGPSSKFAKAALSVSYPVIYNCLSGLKRGDQEAVNLMRSFGAGPISILWKLRLPAALPSLVTGLRIGMTRSTIAVIVTEMVGAYSGLGQIIYRSTALMEYVDVWSAVFVAAIGSMILYSVLVAVDGKLVWWR